MRMLVLLSSGRHPASGRAVAAVRDARALELALRLSGGTGGDILALHAGDPGDPALRDYLGMGLARLEVLAVPAGHDPVPALIARARDFAPDLVLCGAVAEQGEASGMLPYLLAGALGAGVAEEAVGLVRDAAGVRVTCALPRGRREELDLALPAVLAVGLAAPAPRAPAFARARFGRIETVAAVTEPDAHLAAAEFRPWRVRGKPQPRRGTAAERLRAATEMQAGEGRVMIDPAPEEAALAIRDYLAGKGVIGGEAP